MRVKLKTLEVAYQPEFYADQTRCSSKFDRALIGPVLKQKLELVKGLPDPPPPIAWGHRRSGAGRPRGHREGP